MRSRGLAVLLSAALLLPGCATYNFAPPRVELRHITRDNETFNLRCGIGRTNDNTKILRTIKGAEHLTDNFLYAYRCAERQVANGRQHFEVPAMIVGLGGAVAAAAGAPAAVALGTGATVAALDGGKAYYAPKDKLPIFAAAVDALVCVKNASVGVDAYGSTLITAAKGVVDESGNDDANDTNDNDQKDGDKKTKDTAGADKGGNQSDKKVVTAVASSINMAAASAVVGLPGGQIAISATHQYFEMVEGALLSIENIAAQRLSSVGSYAPNAIMTEFKSLEQQQSEEDGQTDSKTAQANAQSAPVVRAAAAATAAADAVKANINNDSAALDAAYKASTDAANKSGAIPAKVVILQGNKVYSTADAADFAAANDGVVSKSMQDALKNPENVLVLDNGKLAVKSFGPAQVAVSSAILTISQLQPKLNECVLRAKL